MKDEAFWVKCKWTYEELNDKTVEFRLRHDERVVNGTGEFKVRKNPDGLLAICIDSALPGKTEFEKHYRRFHVPQLGADAIEKHKTGLKDFECFAPI